MSIGHHEELAQAVFDLTESGFRFIVSPDLDLLANRMVWIPECGRVWSLLFGYVGDH